MGNTSNRSLSSKLIEGLNTLRNFISNSSAEVSTLGWSTYADAAGAAPVDGTGGSPTVTLTRTTSSPLSGDASFLFTKDAANRQGEGASFDFSIDRQDQGKVVSVELEYEIASGTYSGGSDSTNSDLVGYVYDVTNGVMIQLAPFKLSGSVAGQFYKFQGIFQSAINSTSYRLILHVATTSASAFTVKLDRVVVSRQPILFGSPVTDWQSYTPTFVGFGSPTNISMYWRRVGDHIEIEGNFTAGTTTATPGTMSLPSGLSVDTAKIASTVRTQTFGRFVHLTNGGSTSFFNGEGVLTYNGTGTVMEFQKAKDNTSYTFNSSNANALFSSSDVFTLKATIPILGWSSSVQMSNDTDTRVVAASYFLTGNQSIPDATNELIQFTGKHFDTHNTFNISTYTYTVPVKGLYRMSLTLRWTENSNGERINLVEKNGNGIFFELAGSAVNSGTLKSRDSGSIVLNLNAGDTVKFYGNQTRGGALDLTGGADGNLTFFCIECLSGSSTIAANESVASRIGGDPASASSGNPIIWPTVTYDTHGAYNASTGRFTCPVAGLYRVYGQITSANTAVGLNIYKDAVSDAKVGTTDSNGECAFIGAVKCVAGTILDVRPNGTLDADSTSVVYFERIGNG